MTSFSLGAIWAVSDPSMHVIAWAISVRELLGLAKQVLGEIRSVLEEWLAGYACGIRTSLSASCVPVIPATLMHSAGTRFWVTVVRGTPHVIAIEIRALE